MQDKRKIRFPAWAVILDLFGTLLLAAGIYAQIAGDDQVFPEFLRVQEFSILLILLGVLLMLPLVIVVIRQVVSSGIGD